ncbi:MAG: MFS transporter [Alphaproteobacteria bacterium]|nr:MFS transporter [Alphaproteobacteria bacterium]
METISRPPRIRRVQRTALVLLLLGCTLNYVDRSTLAVANPLVRQDLGFSISEMGLLLSAFLWAYAAGQLPSGALVDRFGPRLLLGAGMALWSIAQAVAGFVGNFAEFATARAFLGLGESAQFPGSVRVVRDWFNIGDRGLAIGIYNSGSKLGPAIAPPLLTALMLPFGWRWMFIIMGAVGVVVAAVWFTIYRDVSAVALDPGEAAYLSQGEQPAPPRVTFTEWRLLFAYRATWGMVFGFFGEVYMGWVYQAWLPGYLEIQHHMSIGKTGFVAAIPWIFGVLGSVVGGNFADRLVRRGWTPIIAYKLPIVGGLAGMATFTLLAAQMTDAFAAMICISAAVFFNGICGSACWGLASVVAPRNLTGSLGSIQNSGGYVGGALGPIVTGFVVESTGSFVPALVVSAVIGYAGALIYLLVVPNRPIVIHEHAGAAATAAAQ